jgi:hypothetical protein
MCCWNFLCLSAKAIQISQRNFTPSVLAEPYVVLMLRSTVLSPHCQSPLPTTQQQDACCVTAEGA